VQANLAQLKTELDNKQLPNALLVNKYADALMAQKPDYNDIAQLLKKEATSEGKNYNKLVTRLAAVNLVPGNEREAQVNVQELQMINNAADPGTYNDSLVDVVNTLASLSDGQLAAVNVPRTASSGQQGNALVGNPSYGSWQRNSSGTSFWAWYGMYSLFNNVIGGGRYSYNNWSSRPNSSYYNNYGRERYGSYNDVSRNRDLSKRNPSKYNRTARTSPRYSATARRSSSFGSSSRSSSSRSSAYGSSSRSSSYSSSRGFRSGK